ncbi:putative ATP-grasp-modified RiPP [Streptomyces sp. SP17BM10]|uniref:putative ATP-grasp-modified RiPP n=1 Tax=Streptomyces sp. SP17BM10 TaxID=3002530 RepID=UPI002E7A5B7E|nr:putative ATP-grasp-modified RiPP [Streptomyces sp. SP17BM10]MEE1781639.1 putative ATP-grasp-modified RiPP [Streptomyces sp. SP17BM10]
MSVLTDRLPTLNMTVDGEPSGPLATRPFGLDAVTNPVTVADLPAVAVDPDTQLSLIDGRVAIDLPTMETSGCQTESDGQTVISVDYDQNDD